MKLIRKLKLKKIKGFISFLSLLDITTDICYISSRPMINSFFWKLAVSSVILNILGPAIILIFGQIFNTFIHVCIFKVQKFSLTESLKEVGNLCKLSHSFVYKSILEQDLEKKKAIYRAALLIHITIESFPQMVLQSVTNQKLHLWHEPFGIISISTSVLMILFTMLVVIKTDKYYL